MHCSLVASMSAVLLLVGCATPTTRADCDGEYWPGTVAFATCYGNVDRQQTEMVDSMEWGEAADALGPAGGGALVPPP